MIHLESKMRKKYRNQNREYCILHFPPKLGFGVNSITDALSKRMYQKQFLANSLVKCSTPMRQKALPMPHKSQNCWYGCLRKILYVSERLTNICIANRLIPALKYQLNQLLKKLKGGLSPMQFWKVNH